MVTNKEIASKLRQIADLLDEQRANPFRVSAYLNAAKTIEIMTEPVEDLLGREGFSALLELPGIGEGIARSINEYVMTGRMSRLESLQSGHDPIALFEQIPGIGPPGRRTGSLKRCISTPWKPWNWRRITAA